MNIARIVVPAILAVAGLSGCSSSSDKGAADQDRGIEGTGDTAAAGAPDVNPDGVPYPTKDIGIKARTGSTRGDTIANYKFLGYPDGDISKGLQPMSLASFFDPEGKKYKLIQIQASGLWCYYCKTETTAVTPLRQKLIDRKVAWIITLAEGQVSGTPSTQKDLDKWIGLFKAPYPHFLDPGNYNLGLFYDRAALPGHIIVNAKTMEILNKHTGAATTEEGILKGIDEQLARVDQAVK